MSLTQLEVSLLRNLSEVALTPGAAINLLHGANGSGKTSLLEAIHLLGVGRSFRTLKARRLVQDDQTAAVVFGRTQAGHALGVQKSATGETVVRVNGRSGVTLAELAQQLPVQLFDPESLSILAGPSQPRRQLLDWGVFHVEHAFQALWLRAQRALQQRNSLLKTAKIHDLEMHVWEDELAVASESLHGQREAFMARWLPFLDDAFARLLPDIALRVEYHPGWDLSQPLMEQLRLQRERDRERGFTQMGHHRADLRIRCQGAAVDERLSRGQLKLAACALKLSLVQCLQQAGRTQPVLLLDDLPSELDVDSRRKVCSWVGELGVQAFLTCIEPVQLTGMWGSRPVRMFHVEQGRVSLADE